MFLFLVVILFSLIIEGPLKMSNCVNLQTSSRLLQEHHQSFSCSVFSVILFLFACFRFNFKEGRPASNFDTFPIALLTVFQVSIIVVYYFNA